MMMMIVVVVVVSWDCRWDYCCMGSIVSEARRPSSGSHLFPSADTRLDRHSNHLDHGHGYAKETTAARPCQWRNGLDNNNHKKKMKKKKMMMKKASTTIVLRYNSDGSRPNGDSQVSRVRRTSRTSCRRRRRHPS